MRHHWSFALGAALAIALALPAQEPATPTFDVVSVKHAGDTQSNMIREGNRTRSNTRGFRYTTGSVSCRMPLISVLTEAYQVKAFQVQGPSWISQEVYDMDARMPEGTSKETARLMVQSMLADRLGLKLHREQKEFAIYILVPIPGTKVKLEEITPAPTSFGFRMGMDYIEGMPGMNMSGLAGILSNAAGKPVFDETGFSGYYKVKLQWSADSTPPEPGTVIRLGADSAMISALPQLGLKLEPARRMLDNLVIDKVSKEPTEN